MTSPTNPDSRARKRRQPETWGSQRCAGRDDAEPEADRTRRLLNELQTRQLDLEMQNEVLRKTHLALEQERTHFADFYDHSPTAFMSLNRQAVVVQANLAGARLLEQERQRLIGAPFSRFVARADITRFNNLIDKVFSGGQTDDCELTLCGRGATLHYVHASAMRSYDAQECRLVLVNVTERRRAEEALRAAQRLLTETERIGRVGGWEFDIRSGRQTWTDEVYRIHEVDHGFDPSVTSGLSFYAPASRPLIERAVQRAVEFGEPFDLELEFITARGQTRWVHAIGQRDLERHRVHGFFQDITEHKQMEAQMNAARCAAEQANSAKSRFLAAASHDLNQPMFALGLYMNALGKKISPPDDDFVNNMSKCVSSLNTLLTDLLDISRLEAGVVDARPSHFPLAEMLTRLVAVHGPHARAIGLRLHCRPTDVQAYTDPVLLARMLGNIIANALRYTQHGGVLIACRRRRGRQWVEVWDSGIGIPADKTQEIFEEYRQLNPHWQSPGGASIGSGLGLAIVAKTAGLLGLEVRVASRLGKGSMFAVEIPPGAKIAFTEPVVRPLRIALVDDDLGVLDALGKALLGAGHPVVQATTGKKLLRLLGHEAPDAIVSDYHLRHGESGVQVIEDVRRAFGKSIPACILTAETDTATLRALAAQGIPVLRKPMDIDELLATLAGLRRTAPKNS